MLYWVIIILIIVLIKAIFSAADTAFTYMNRAEIRQLSKTDKKAQKIKILMEDSNRFFGTVEVMINMCELLASAVASISVLEELKTFIERFDTGTNFAIVVSVFIVTVILSYIMLVFGGVLPKRIARNNPKKTAYRVVNIVWVISKLNRPIEKLISVSTSYFSKKLNIKEYPEEKLTEKQLKMIIREAKDEGILENLEKRILINTLKANSTKASKVMIPIEETYLINIDSSIEEILKNIKTKKFTRIPVYEGEKSNIIGIFNIKSILTEYLGKLDNKEQIRNTLKEPIYIDENEKIFTTFGRLQKQNQIVGIVVNKEKVPIGIISLEDILETLVGKIYDEDDKKI